MQTLHEQEPVETAPRPENWMQPTDQTALDEQKTLPPRPGKRFVSRSRYLRAQAKRAGLNTLAVGSWIAATLCVSFCFSCLDARLLEHVFDLWHIPGRFVSIDGRFTMRVLCGLSLLFATIAWVSARIGMKAQKSAAQIDPGLPLTRANSVRLAAPDTLVRASAEPVQAQETVLLRATVEGRQTPSEQLVRAVGGQE